MGCGSAYEREKKKCVLGGNEIGRDKEMFDRKLDMGVKTLPFVIWQWYDSVTQPKAHKAGLKKDTAAQASHVLACTHSPVYFRC